VNAETAAGESLMDRLLRIYTADTMEAQSGRDDLAKFFLHLDSVQLGSASVSPAPEDPA
jgi:hypothetical protein